MNRLLWVLLPASIGLFFLWRSVEARTETPTAVVRADDPALFDTGPRLLRGGRPFTGVVEARYPGGALRSRTTYQDGRREGLQLTCFPNGQLADRRSWTDGFKDGIHRGWWPDGRPRYVTSFREGLSEGVSMEWFDLPGSPPYRRFHYAKGREDGLQRAWGADGALRTNYVAVDGQRFGKLGAKECK